MRKSIKASFLILFLLSFLLSYLFEMAQAYYNCLGNLNCRLWGSFGIFTWLNVFLLYGIGIFFKLRTSKVKRVRSWIPLYTILMPVIVLLYLFSIYLGFRTYAQDIQAHIQLESYRYIPSFPFIIRDIQTFSEAEIDHIGFLWHIRRLGTCYSTEFIYLKNGAVYPISNYGSALIQESFPKYLQRQGIRGESIANGLEKTCQ